MLKKGNGILFKLVPLRPRPSQDCAYNGLSLTDLGLLRTGHTYGCPSLLYMNLDFDLNLTIGSFYSDGRDLIAYFGFFLNLELNSFKFLDSEFNLGNVNSEKFQSTSAVMVHGIKDN